MDKINNKDKILNQLKSFHSMSGTMEYTYLCKYTEIYKNLYTGVYEKETHNVSIYKLLYSAKVNIRNLREFIITPYMIDESLNRLTRSILNFENNGSNKILYKETIKMQSYNEIRIFTFEVERMGLLSY